MTNSVRNKAIVQNIYQSYTESMGAARDAIYDNMASDLTWRSMAPESELRFCKDGTGKRAIEDYFDRLYQDWEMLRFDVEEFVAEGAKVVVLSDVEFRNIRNGNIYASPKVDVWTFNDKGEVADFIEFFDSHRAVSLT